MSDKMADLHLRAGHLMVRKPKDEYASCVFCTSRTASHEVFSSHPSRTMHIYFCRDCMESLVCQA